MKGKYTLITNIDMAQVMATGLRLEVYALLLEDHQSFFNSGDHRQLDYRVRGFRTDGASPVFSLSLKESAQPVQLTERVASNNFQLLPQDGSAPRPIFEGKILQIPGFELYLNISDRNYPFDITEHTEVLEVWDALEVKVIKYWTAPNMPTLQWVDANAAKAIHNLPLSVR